MGGMLTKHCQKGLVSMVMVTMMLTLRLPRMLTVRMTRRQGHDVRAGSASLGLPPPSSPPSFFSSSSNPFSHNLTLPTNSNIFQVLHFLPLFLPFHSSDLYFQIPSISFFIWVRVADCQISKIIARNQFYPNKIA